MKRGNRRLPTAVKAARGTLQPCRENPDAPQIPPPAWDDPPSDLKGEGLAVWKRLQPHIFGPIVTEGDLETFANYCRIWTALRRVQRLVATSSVDLAIAKGYMGQMLKLTTQHRQLAAELGLTPSSRGSVKSAEKKPESKLSEFIRQPLRAVK